MTTPAPDAPCQPERTRVAVVVFADVTPRIAGAPGLLRRLLEEKLGEFDGTEHSVRLAGAGREFHIRLHDAIDAGVALGNGYLWAQPTRKAFEQHEWWQADDAAQGEDR